MELPLNIEVLPNGKVKFDNATYTINELKPKAHEVAKSLADQTVVVMAHSNASSRQVKKVVAILVEAKFKVVVAKERPQDSLKPSLMATRPISLAPLPPPSSETATTTAAPSEDDSVKKKQLTPSTPSAPSEPAAPFANGPGDTVP